MRRIKLFTVFSHIAGLAMFLSLPILFVSNRSGDVDFMRTLLSSRTLLFISTYIFIFYFNTYFLVPVLYRKNRLVLYIISVVLLFAAVAIVRPFDHLMNDRRAGMMRRENQPPAPQGEFDRPFPGGDSMRPPMEIRRPGPGGWQGRHQPSIDIISIFLFLITLSFSLSIEFRQRLRHAEQRALKADADKANAELSLLKAQINPHFLFNTLNNIYSLSATKSDKAPESIMKLSNIMRYVTDDVNEDFVPLENEIAFMSDYIDLQKLRLNKWTTVDFKVTGEIDFKKIAPLILMSFVENVFKYGISNHTASDILIHLSATEHTIEFFCQNKLSEKPPPAERAGIGISNARQRLDYLYPVRHLLNISQEDGKFTVKLLLQV